MSSHYVHTLCLGGDGVGSRFAFAEEAGRFFLLRPREGYRIEMLPLCGHTIEDAVNDFDFHIHAFSHLIGPMSYVKHDVHQHLSLNKIGEFFEEGTDW